MTQRIFDIFNVKDMQEFWEIIPEEIDRVKKDSISDKNIPYNAYYGKDICWGGSPLIKIDWHDKTEITRPIQEATEQDINNGVSYGILEKISTDRDDFKYLKFNCLYKHCHRLNKQEIEELI